MSHGESVKSTILQHHLCLGPGPEKLKLPSKQEASADPLVHLVGLVGGLTITRKQLVAAASICSLSWDSMTKALLLEEHPTPVLSNYQAT